MADGVILLVDAQEGPKPQTKFVLQKAFELDLKPILIINKIDKAFAEPKRILENVNDIFWALATNESQLDFPVLYAIGRERRVFSNLLEDDLTIPYSIEGDMRPLLDTIIEYIPSPTSLEGPFQMLIS